jgi:pyruvate dehydrogenase E1 component
MVTNQEDVFYYITVMNENYAHPALPAGAEGGILKGMYLFKAGGKHKLRAQLLGSGTILREVIAAAELLEAEWKVSADVWSAPSFTELRREGLDADRWNLLHPEQVPREPYVTRCLGERSGPVVAATDYVKAFADQIRPFIPRGREYRVLGTDGFGRSDSRQMLRHFFEVNRHWVVVAALKALADQGDCFPTLVAQAIKKYGLDPNKPNPVTV